MIAEFVQVGVYIAACPFLCVCLQRLIAPLVSLYDICTAARKLFIVRYRDVVEVYLTQPSPTIKKIKQESFIN